MKRKILAAISLLLIGALCLPMTAIKSKAANTPEDYKPLAASSVVKDWNFTDGLNVLSGTPYDNRQAIIAGLDKTANTDWVDKVGKQAKDKSFKYGDEGITLKFVQGYKSYNNDVYDIYINFKIGDYSTDLNRTETKDSVLSFNECQIKTGPGAPNYWLSFKLNGGIPSDYHYEIWLVKNNGSYSNLDEAYGATSIDSTKDKDELFIAGSCFMASLTNTNGEAARPWSWNNILYANSNRNSVDKTKFYWQYNSVKNWWESTGGESSENGKNTNASDAFVIGYGYTETHTIKGGYVNLPGNGGFSELLLGYRTRTVTFLPSQDSVDNGHLNATGSIGPNDKREYLEQSYTKNTNPKDVPPAVTPNAGAYFTYWTTETDVKLEDGTVVKAGNPITEAELTQLYVDKDLTFYAHTSTQELTGPFTLKYESNGGTTFLDESYDKGADTKIFTTGDKFKYIPTKPGYTFGGWYYDSALTQPVNSEIKMYQNEIVYAKWNTVSIGGIYTPPSSVTLSFDTNGNGGYDKPDSQSGNSGFTGKVPADIKVGDIIDGYKFTGWFKDKDGKEPFDFKTGISTNTTAYAGWEKVEENTTPDPEKPVVKVEFETEIGVPPATQVEVPGNTAEDPGAPMDLSTLKPGTVINGYRFEGWYLDKDYTIKYDFNTPVTEDIVLYAKWTALGVAKSPKTGEPIFPMTGGIATSLAGLALLGGLLIITSLKRRREDIYS